MVALVLKGTVRHVWVWEMFIRCSSEISKKHVAEMELQKVTDSGVQMCCPPWNSLNKCLFVSGFFQIMSHL